MALNVKEEPVEEMLSHDDVTGRRSSSPCRNTTGMISSSPSLTSPYECQNNNIDMKTKFKKHLSVEETQERTSPITKTLDNKDCSQQAENSSDCYSKVTLVSDNSELNTLKENNNTENSKNKISTGCVQQAATNINRIEDSFDIKSATGQNFVKDLEQFVASVSIPTQRPSNQIHMESSSSMVYPHHVSKHVPESSVRNNMSQKSHNMISKDFFLQSQSSIRSQNISHMPTNRNIYDRTSELSYRSRPSINAGIDQPIDLSVKKSDNGNRSNNNTNQSADMSGNISISYVSPLPTDTESSRSTLASLEEKFGARSSILNEIGTRSASLSDRFGFACSGGLYESGAIVNGYQNATNNLLNCIQRTTNNNLYVKNSSQNDYKIVNDASEASAVRRSREVSRDSDEMSQKFENNRQTTQSRKNKANGTLFTAQRESQLCDFINEAARQDKINQDHGYRGKTSLPSLHCLECSAAFHSLQELTVHMIRTEHYLNLVGAQDLLYQTRPTQPSYLKPPSDEEPAVSPNSSTDTKRSAESPPMDDFGNFWMYWKSLNLLQMQSLRQASAIKPVIFYPPVKNSYLAEDAEMFNRSDYLARRSILYVDPRGLQSHHKLEEDESLNISSTGIEHGKTDSSYTGSPLSRLSTSSSDTTDSSYISHGPKSREVSVNRRARKRSGDPIELERRIIQRSEDYELKSTKRVTPNQLSQKTKEEYQRYREEHLNGDRRFSKESSEPRVRHESDSFRSVSDKYIQAGDNFNHPGAPSALTSLQNLVYGSAERQKSNTWLSKSRIEHDGFTSSRCGLQKPRDLTIDISLERRKITADYIGNRSQEAETIIRSPGNVELNNSAQLKRAFIPVCDSTQETKEDYCKKLKVNRDAIGVNEHEKVLPCLDFTLPRSTLSRDIVSDGPRSRNAAAADETDVMRRPFSTPAIIFGNDHQKGRNEAELAEINQKIASRNIELSHKVNTRNADEQTKLFEVSFLRRQSESKLQQQNGRVGETDLTKHSRETPTSVEANNSVNSERGINWSENRGENMSKSILKSLTSQECESGALSWQQSKDIRLLSCTKNNIDATKLRESPIFNKDQIVQRNRCETWNPLEIKTNAIKQIATSYDANNRFAKYYELAKELQGKP